MLLHGAHQRTDTIVSESHAVPQAVKDSFRGIYSFGFFLR
jgi:hypothetical protein